MILILLTVTFALAVVPLSAQSTPFDGPINISVDELVFEQHSPTIALNLSTVGEYPCYNYRLSNETRQRGDTIEVVLLGLAYEELCSTAWGPARLRLPLGLTPGTYTVAVTKIQDSDELELTVSPTRLALRPQGNMRFLQVDTSAFLRPAPQSFLVSCGTPNVPELCADLNAWLVHQPGIERRVLVDSSRIGFPRYGGYLHNSYTLYEYTDPRALDPVRRCLRHAAEALSQSVGAGITLQTASGEVMRAWSTRSYHEPHIPVPRQISGSHLCP